MTAERAIEKVNAERVVLLGWGAAILMQMAHPLVAAGIDEHSTALTSIATRLRRLRRTVDVMLALNFAPPAEAQRAAAGVNAIHRRVNGQLGMETGAHPAGAPYSAEDPALLKWVLATLMYALPRAYELFVGPLTAAEKVQFCHDGVAIAELLNLPAHDVPPTMEELQAYLDATVAGGQAAVGETARRLARDLFWPPVPFVLRPLLAFARLPAIGLLPPDLRAAFGFRWERRHAVALRLMAVSIRLALPLLPARVRRWPAARDAARRRARADGDAGPARGDAHVFREEICADRLNNHAYHEGA